MPPDSKLPPQGRFKRFRKLAALSAQVGADVVSRSVQRWTGADAAPVLSAGTAEKLVATLGDLKGAAMKLGQVVSMDAELLTPEIQAILSRLQNEAPPMPFQTVKEVVESELGASLKTLFASFEPAPLAAASLGQVHRATLGDGRVLAVKVQYPGIDQALASDVENLGLVIKALSKVTQSLDGRAYYQELRHELIQELDYLREADLCEALGPVARSIDGLEAPQVIRERTSSKVLSLELLPGPTLRAFAASGPSPEERFRVSRLLIRAVYGPLLVSGRVHADPHPGNFIVMPNGKLGLVDFGSVKRFSDAFVAADRNLLLRALKHEVGDPLQVLREVGFDIQAPEDEARALAQEILSITGRPLRSEVYDFSRCTMTSDLKKLVARKLPTALKLRPPQEALLFFRAIGGCTHNLRMLGARGGFRGVFEELTALYPKT